MWLRVVAVAGVVGTVSLGCAYGEVRQVVRAQFASELDCPEVTIIKRDAWYAYDKPNQFKVSGCGVMRTYTCTELDGRVSYDTPACTWVEGDIDAPTINKPKPQDPALDEAEEFGDEPPADDMEGVEPDEGDSLEDEGGTEEEGDDAEPQGSVGGSASGGFRLGVGNKK